MQEQHPSQSDIIPDTSDGVTQRPPDPLDGTRDASWPLLHYSITTEAASVGLASAFLALLAISLLSMIVGPGDSSPDIGSGTSDVLQLLHSLGAPGSVLALGLSNVIVGPVTEELVYRGILLPSLASWLGLPAAIVVSSFAFGAYHFSWEELPALTLLGLLLAACTVKSRGNLLAPTLAHMVYNLVAFGSLVLEAVEPVG